ncbi:hypothetical protein CVV73_25195, partial [Enterobacter hormaechei]
IDTWKQISGGLLRWIGMRKNWRPSGHGGEVSSVVELVPFDLFGGMLWKIVGYSQQNVVLQHPVFCMCEICSIMHMRTDMYNACLAFRFAILIQGIQF